MVDSIEDKLTQAAQARREHRSADALRLYDEARTEAQSSAQPLQSAVALTGIGQICRDMDDRPAALAHYSEAIEVLRTANDPMRLAHTLRHAGDIASELGQLDQARAYIAETLDIYRHRKDVPPLELANTLRVFALNDERRLRTVWQEAASLYASAGVAAGVNESKSHIQNLSA